MRAETASRIGWVYFAGWALFVLIWLVSTALALAAGAFPGDGLPRPIFLVLFFAQIVPLYAIYGAATGLVTALTARAPSITMACFGLLFGGLSWLFGRIWMGLGHIDCAESCSASVPTYVEMGVLDVVHPVMVIGLPLVMLVWALTQKVSLRRR